MEPIGDFLLPDDILKNILSLIPLKPRTRLKLVSQNWCHVITCLRREGSPQTTSYGLVLESEGYKNGVMTSDTNFMSVQDKEGVELKATVTIPGLRLIASSNGLLLYGRKVYRRAYYVEFMVYSPITKQRVFVPMTTRKIPSDSFTGFVFDETKRHFKIICFFKVYKYFIEMFSSETCDWYKYENGIPSAFGYHDLKEDAVSFSYDDGGKTCFKAKVYPYLHVYDIEKDSFEVLSPHAEFSWADPEGKLYCCGPVGKSILEIFVMEENGRWKRTQHSISGSSEFYEPKPVSFNADLQTLYIQCHCKLFAYSLETKSLSIVFLHPLDYSPPRIFSFLFKPVDMSHFHLKIQ